MPKVILNHGAGGELMQQFLSDHITKHFPKMDAEVPLDSMDDSAVVDDIVFTIDGHTVTLTGCSLGLSNPDRSQGQYDETIAVTALDMSVV